MPILGTKRMTEITTHDVEKLVEKLDENTRADLCDWKTSFNVWGVTRKLLDDSARSKTLNLPVRSDNPALGVRAPDRGAKKAKTYLYPSEFHAIMNGEPIPLEDQRSVALAIYLYVRASEQRAITWNEFDSD